RRDYSACAARSRLTSETLDCGGSDISAPGNFFRFIDTDDGWHIGPDRTFVPGITLFNFGPYNYFQRPDERKIAGAFAKFEASDAFVPYVEAMYMDDRSLAQIAPSANFFRTDTINCDNPLMSAQQLALVCQTGNFVGEEDGGQAAEFVDPVTGNTYHQAWLFIGRRSIETAPRQNDIRHKNLRLLGGVRGELGKGWSYDAYYLFGRLKFASTYLNDLSITRIGRALDVISDPATGQPECRSALTGEDPNCVPWDIFALNSVSPEAAAYLPLTGTSEGTLKQRSVVASVTGQLGEYGITSPWADEGLVINVGVEYRKDSIDYRPEEIFADLAGQDLVPRPLKGSFDVKEAFIEARLPIVTNRFLTDLSIEGGYRRSRYDNGLNRFSSDSYKLGLSFAPIPDIRLRASYNRAIRAPNVQELFAEQQIGPFVENDPCAGPVPQATPEQCAAMGVTAAQYGNILKSPINRYNSLSGGNLNLGPETATTKTIGVVLQPGFLPGFSATVDWFDIELKDAIFVLDGQLTVDHCRQTLDPRFCNRIHRDQFGSLWLTRDGYVDDLPINIGSFKTSGVDIGLDYRRAIGSGSIEINVLGTWLDKFVEDDGGRAKPFDCAGLFGFFCSVPKPTWRHKARLTWHLADTASLSLQWRRFGGVKFERSSDNPGLANPFSPHDERISAQNYFDLTALFPVTKAYEFRLGITNIFDREPPIVGTGFGACPLPYCNGNTYPQVYDALGRYFFAGVTVDF
ncbi:MAG TPA: TonB-dependent receptor, partial [Pseudolabrys sp.]|nr:TonB-dependent receptor [Pseudolabrys sp.]